MVPFLHKLQKNLVEGGTAQHLELLHLLLLLGTQRLRRREDYMVDRNQVHAPAVRRAVINDEPTSIGANAVAIACAFPLNGQHGLPAH